MRKLLPILILSTLFVSCAQEVLEPEQQISGMFALDDGSCLVRAYLSFENGRLSQYSATTPYPFAEGKIWHTDSRAFQLANKQNYSIRDGVLTASDGVSGPAELKDGVLTIGSKRYVALEGFEEVPYSRIVAQNEYVFTYMEQDISIPFTVENPLPGKELKVSLSSSASGGTWITNLAVQEGKITAHISATAEDRTGIIELSYTHAESVTVQIKQQPSTFITIPETSRTVDYTPSTQTLNYTIENPVATSSLTATSSASWINNIQVSTNRISFDVQENNTGADRNATLTLRYEGARDVTFNVLQRWSASSITLTPSSKEVDYTGGTFTFNYAVTNPREGISLTATSQSNWITNVTASGNSINYKVAENNSATQRAGKIKLTYGTYATVEFAVTQSEKPVMSLTLNKSELALLTGASETLIATVDPTDASLQWSSNKTSVATVDQNGKVTAMGNGNATIFVASGEKTAKCTVTVTTAVTGVSLNKTSLNFDEIGKSETLIATISPSTASNKSVTWTSGNTSFATVDQSGKVKAIAKGTALITVTTIDGGYTAYCTVTVLMPAGAVDLGLPSGLLWASYNLGASMPWDYGDYYAWGETEPKSDYSWTTYKWCYGSSTSLKKYCTTYTYGTVVDNITELQRGEMSGETVDDAARAKLGGKWRMPTYDEWEELRNNCIWTWTDNYNGTGVKGRIVAAPNGNSIFLPAAGWRSNANLNEATSGYYWSSSLGTSDSRRARCVHFNSDGVYRAAYYRYEGFPVRPVYKE